MGMLKLRNFEKNKFLNYYFKFFEKIVFEKIKYFSA